MDVILKLNSTTALACIVVYLKLCVLYIRCTRMHVWLCLSDVGMLEG